MQPKLTDPEPELSPEQQEELSRLQELARIVQENGAAWVIQGLRHICYLLAEHEQNPRSQRLAVNLLYELEKLEERMNEVVEELKMSNAWNPSTEVH